MKTGNAARRHAVWAILALFITFVFAFSGCALFTSGYTSVSDWVPEESALTPMIYESGDEVYLVCGTEKQSLGKKDELFADGYQLFSEGGYVFYKDNAGGRKKLMRVAADLSSTPEALADGVCAAQASSDGSKALYITDITYITGTLYLWEQGKAPRAVAENVLPLYFGLSPQGKCLYYIVQQYPGVIDLFVMKEDGEPILVTRQKDAAYIDYGIKLDSMGGVFADDEGKVLYTINSYSDSNFYSSGESGIYLFSGTGESEKICDDGYIEMTFGKADDFLFSTWGIISQKLWHKAPGSEPVVVFEGDYYTYFTSYYYGMGFTEGGENDKHFLVAQGKSGLFDIGKAQLSEVMLGGRTVPVAVTDEYMKAQQSPAMNCVVYKRDGKTFASRKMAGKWIEEQLSDMDVTYSVYFDEACRNLYFMEIDYEEQFEEQFEDGESYWTNLPGPLYRYSIETGEKTLLMENVTYFMPSGDNGYVTTGDENTYRISESGTNKIADRMLYPRRTRNGDFLIGEDGLFFLADGAEEVQTLLGEGDSYLSYVLDYSSSIDYSPPLEEDPGNALITLTQDAYFYVAQLGSYDYYYEEPYLSLEEAERVSRTLADVLKPGEDGSYAVYYDGYYEYRETFAYLADGFLYYRMYMEGAGDEYKDKASESFTAALEEYDGGYWGEGDISLKKWNSDLGEWEDVADEGA